MRRRRFIAYHWLPCSSVCNGGCCAAVAPRTPSSARAARRDGGTAASPRRAAAPAPVLTSTHGDFSGRQHGGDRYSRVLTGTQGGSGVPSRLLPSRAPPPHAAAAPRRRRPRAPRASCSDGVLTGTHGVLPGTHGVLTGTHGVHASCRGDVAWPAARTLGMEDTRERGGWGR